MADKKRGSRFSKHFKYLLERPSRRKKKETSSAVSANTLGQQDGNQLSQPNSNNSNIKPTFADEAVEEPAGTLSTLSTSTPQPPTQPSQQLSLRKPALDQSNIPQWENCTLADRLWNEAYESLREEDSKLVLSYEEILSHSLLEAGVEDQARNPRSTKGQLKMAELVMDGLDKTSREDKIKEKINKIHDSVEVVNALTVLKAVRAFQEVAVAQTAFSLLFEVLSNPITESLENRKGVKEVLTDMSWYCKLSELLLGKEDPGPLDDLRGELQGQMIILFKKLLTFQIKSICSYNRRRGAEFMRQIVKYDDWANALQDVREAKSAFNEKAMQYRQLRDSSYFKMSQNDKENKECMQALYLTDSQDEKEQIKERKGHIHADSSSWILEHGDFKRWNALDGEVNLLWIKGDPGKGKTMLLITIIDYLEKSSIFPSVPLLYFFCQGTNEKFNNSAAVMRGLLHMLAKKQPSLIRYLREKYDITGDRLFEKETAFIALSRIFRSMLQDKALTGLTIVIDALDECIEGQQQLLNFIGDISRSNNSIKWLLSSRNITAIEQKLETDHSRIRLALELNGNPEFVSAAVNAYITHKVSCLQSLKDAEEHRRKVQKELQEKANGTFLWVALAVQALEKYKTPGETLKAVKRMPEGLEALYKEMWNRMSMSLEHSELGQCHAILSTVVLAYYPLLPAEIRALCFPESEDPTEDTIITLVHECGSFLTTENGRVVVIHQSVKDFFVPADSPKSVLFSGPRGVAGAHIQLSIQSLSTLSGVLRTNIYGLSDSASLEEALRKRPNPDPLEHFGYNILYWSDHYCAAYERNYEALVANEIPNDELIKLDAFLKNSFLAWLEAVCLLQNLQKGIRSLRLLERLLRNRFPKSELIHLVYDYLRFTLRNASLIAANPIQVYLSALLFSPLNSLVRKHYRDLLNWVAVKPLSILESSWTPCLQTINTEDAPLHIAISSDGEFIASASGLDVLVRDAETGTVLKTLEGHRKRVGAVAFSPDGTHLASGSDDETIKIWEWRSDSAKAAVKTLQGHTSAVTSIAFSPDGSHLASGSMDRTIKIWELKSGVAEAAIKTLEGHTDSVRSIAFSPDGSNLASGSGDGEVKIWEWRSHSAGRTVRTLDVRGRSVWSVAFSPDGSHLASGSRDKTIKIWHLPVRSNFSEVTLVRTLEGHKDSIESVAFSPDGNHLASGSDDKTIKIWEWHSDSANTTVKTLKGHTDWIYSVVFSPDGSHVVSGSRDKTIKIWDLRSDFAEGATKKFEGHTDWVQSVAFSPDGRHLASGSDDKTVKIWDLTSDTMDSTVKTLEGHTGWVRSVAFSQDGSRVASGSNDNTVKVWDWQSDAAELTVKTLKSHTGSVRSVAFSPEGNLLASGSSDNTVKIWDLQSESLETTAKTLQGHTNWVQSVAFSPDESQLASWSDDKTIRFWDFHEGKHLKTIEKQSVINCSCVYSNGFLRYTDQHLSDNYSGGALGKLSRHVPLHDFHVYKHDSNSAIIVKWGKSAMLQFLYNSQLNEDDPVAFTMLSSRASVKACVGIGTKSGTAFALIIDVSGPSFLRF